MKAIYTAQNCSFSCPLQWGLTVFWRLPVRCDDWFQALAAATENDGIRLLRHRLLKPDISQFSLSTRPEVAPERIVHRVKGRLQHLLRQKYPRAFKRHYALRSLGKVNRSAVEGYVARQLEHHRMADPSLQNRFKKYQISNPNADLKRPRRTSHGMYWYNLHIVLVNAERWREIQDPIVRSMRDMILRCCAAKGFALSRGGVLPDHLHLLLGCHIAVSPLDVALGFLNNLAYVRGMRPIFQFGGFVGTVGEYDSGALKGQTSPHGNEPRGGA